MIDDDWVLLSEIEHWIYCPRQWAIIHHEQHFTDNDDTTRGHLEHQRVDAVGHESRHGVQVYWAVDVASDIHRLRGRCDRIVVEGGRFVPVEHKSGRRSHHSAMIQLVGQAICLEEMLGIPVARGRIYLAASNTFKDVEVGNEELRAAVHTAASGVRVARADQSLPRPANDARCPACSLNETCLPRLVDDRHRQRGLHGATWWP
ncbi:CRISPR-associated protein Cas4 [Mycobacterium canetti]|uniref:CRISPR-associated protein Cas4 n=1 Tax=Mycobacterium canetti TaxID=78331 RepID=UPI0002A585C1|nr:Putative exonuclease (modular protein) [Mycobacterium canettii CIPT 140070010]